MKLLTAICLATVAHGRPSLLQRMNSVIPLFPRKLASAEGRELEPVSDAFTFYEGSCYVSQHGQRSAACSVFKPQAEVIELSDDATTARHHPLHA
mmetsp:Transcript_11136/g.33381  ORF Transcript_11136/g.33381 Transcript_11136/m.33381 type:complete len:95 (-) Transcript_11136:1757-2041(-)